MSYDAKVIEIMIASPGDVMNERHIIREVIDDWNAHHARERGVVLLATGWETHSSPDLSGRAQQLINDRILLHSDLVVGVFWTRIGSPTGKSISGTVEEIQKHHGAGKPVMLYFSKASVPMDQIDHEHLDKIAAFKAWVFERGLVGSYDSLDDFRTKLQRQLPITLRDNSYLKRETKIDLVSVFEAELSARQPVQLSADARELLIAAATSNGNLMIRRHLGGTSINAGTRALGSETNKREVARWTAAIEELRHRGLLAMLTANEKFLS